MASNSTKQEQTKIADTSSQLQKPDEIKDVSTSSGVNLPKGDVKMDATKSDESSEHQNLEKVEKTSASTDDSNSSSEEQQYDKATAASQTKLSTSRQPKANPNLKRFETADITDIHYKDESDLLESVLENTTDKRLIDRLLGCAYGQALGDAYGLSTEFEDRERVARKYPNDSFIPFPNYVPTGHNRRWQKGDWTDDTDQWILILLTLMFHDGDEKVFAKKLHHWIYHGYPELGDHGGLGLGANVSQVML